MNESNVVALRDREPEHAVQPLGQPVQALMPVNMEQAMKLATLMAEGKLVPQHLQASPADCLMVIEQAARWRMSPFAVAQATSSVKGKLMFEGKLVAAAIHTSGVLSKRLQYEFSGEGMKRTVKVIGYFRGESEPQEVEVMLGNVVTENGCWKKQPDQQLCYTGARVWARRHAPEVMLGVYSPEEDFDELPPTGSQPKARPERESYSDDAFTANFPSWEKAINANKKSAEDLIKMVESKATLTDEQKKKIRAVTPAAAQTEAQS